MSEKNNKPNLEELKEAFTDAVVKNDQDKKTKNKKDLLTDTNKNDKLKEHINNLGEFSETFINTMLQHTESHKLWNTKVKELAELEQQLVKSMDEADNYLMLSDKYIQLIITFIEKGFLDEHFKEDVIKELQAKNMLFLQDVYKNIQSSILMETNVSVVIDNDEMTVFLLKDRNRFVNPKTNETQYMSKHNEFRLTYQDSIQNFTTVNGNKDILEDVELIVFPKQHNYNRTIKTLVINPQMLIELVDLILTTKLENKSTKVSNVLVKEPHNTFEFDADGISLAVFKSNKIVYKHPMEILETIKEPIERVTYNKLLKNKQATALATGILYVKNIKFANDQSTDVFELVNIIERFKVKGKSLQKLLPNSYSDNDRIIISENSLIDLAGNIKKFIVPISGT